MASDLYLSEQENTGGALNICLGQQMFSKPPLKAPKDQSPKISNTGTPDRGQDFHKKQSVPQIHAQHLLPT